MQDSEQGERPTEPGLYAWVPEQGYPSLVLVDRRPSAHSPGHVLNGHTVTSSNFYDGCAIANWPPSRWVDLRALATPAGVDAVPAPADSVHSTSDFVAHGLPTPLPQDGWRSIDTAPKDGKDLLLWDGGLRRLCFWDRPNERWSVWPGRAECKYPTHWMPLPPPPGDQAPASQDDREAAQLPAGNEVRPQNQPESGGASPRTVAPEGWKLVPIEATEAMLVAAMKTMAGGWCEETPDFLECGVIAERGLSQDDADSINAECMKEHAVFYRAMLAASPRPSTEGAEQEARKLALEALKDLQDWVAAIAYKNGIGDHEEVMNSPRMKKVRVAISALRSIPEGEGMDARLRDGVRQITLSLREREWADLLTADPDLAALEAEVRALVEGGR